MYEHPTLQTLFSAQYNSSKSICLTSRDPSIGNDIFLLTGRNAHDVVLYVAQNGLLVRYVKLRMRREYRERLTRGARAVMHAGIAN